MMFAAAMVSAPMVVVMVMFAVVAALYIRIEVQAACDKCFHCFVSISCNAAVKFNACCIESHACTAADTAADQSICIETA